VLDSGFIDSEKIQARRESCGTELGSKQQRKNEVGVKI